MFIETKTATKQVEATKGHKFGYANGWANVICKYKQTICKPKKKEDTGEMCLHVHSGTTCR